MEKASRKDSDYEAVVYEGCVYCLDCIPAEASVGDDEIIPIEAGETWDAPAECERCGKRHEYMKIAG